MPSGLVITRLPVPLMATAQNNDSSGDQQTLIHWLSAALVWAVQLTPSGEVITRLPTPLEETAQNSDRSGDQQTLNQVLSAALVREVQAATPSGTVPIVARNAGYAAREYTAPFACR